MEELISQLLSSLKGIWKYRWQALAVAWITALAGWVRVYTLPDDFQITARVYVDTQSILKPLLSGMTSVPNVEQQVAIMGRTLLSRPNIERVMRSVDLDVRAATARERELQVDELMSKLKISAGNANDIYTISYNNKDAKLGRDVVQSLLQIFQEGSFKDKRGDSQKAVQFIDEQIKSYEDKLVTAENALKEFKLRNNSLLPRQGVDYNAQLGIAADVLNAARLELTEAEHARNSIKSQISGDEPVLGLDLPATAIQNPELDGRISLKSERSKKTRAIRWTTIPARSTAPCCNSSKWPRAKPRPRWQACARGCRSSLRATLICWRKAMPCLKSNPSLRN